MWGDFRLALRQLTLTPGYSLVCILALALGIGATSTAFTAFNAVVLKPMPWIQESGGVMALTLFHQVQAEGEMGLSYPDYEDLRRLVTRMDGIAVHQERTFILTDSEKPERYLGSSVSASAFRLLRVAPVVGRDFLPEEEFGDGPPVILLGHELWMRRYGGDTNLVGRTIQVSGQPATVIGVMPPGWRYPERSDLWTTIQASPGANLRGLHYLGAIGRLGKGVNQKEAEEELERIMEGLSLEHPETHRGVRARLTPYREWVVRDSGPLLGLMLGSVLCVQLIACANVANLVLARGTRRMREVAVRVALGASAGAILRWLVAEVMVLGAAGSLLGVLFTLWGAGWVHRSSPDELPFWMDLSPDLGVVGFAVALGLGSAFLAGLVPAVQLARPALAADVRALGRGTVGLGRHARMRHTLVVVELALAMVLVTGAGLLLRSFHRASSMDPGFDSRQLLTFRVGLPPAHYKDQGQYIRFFEEVRNRLSRIDGIAQVGGVSLLPASGYDSFGALEIEGQDPKSLFEAPSAQTCAATPGALEALGVRLIQGRMLEASDVASSLPVAVVDETFAKRFFPGGSALLKRFRPASATDGINTNAWIHIVGVVGNVAAHFHEAPPLPVHYRPHAQSPTAFLSMVVRTGGEPKAVVGAVESAVLEVNREIPIYYVQTMEEILRRATWDKRFFVGIFGIMAGLALFLVILGIYGVMAYSVSMRIQELGVRMALGATRSDVLRLVLKQGMRLVGLGLGVGLLSALGLARLLKDYLFGISPQDPLTLLLAAGMLAVVGLVACLIPARRATRIDPMVALRSE
jgi:putative ABC transport system permease protein